MRGEEKQFSKGSHVPLQLLDEVCPQNAYVEAMSRTASIFGSEV